MGFEWVDVVGVLASYLLGGIPFGLILARRIAHVDPSKAGSGNIGATNVARTAGKGLGALTLVLDAAKGALPVLLATGLGRAGSVTALAGLASIVGHVFSPYLRFKGGKGVATALGVFLALSPASAGVAGLAFGGVFLAVRKVSAGSVAGVVALILGSIYADGRSEVIWSAVVAALIILAKHRANIERLLKGTELSMNQDTPPPKD